MAKRKAATPALYEVMHARSAPRAPVEAEPARGEPPAQEFLLSPGRVVRLPVGYVLLATAGAIVLAIVTYVLGYNRGHAEASQRADQRLVDSSRTASIMGQTQDPLASDGGGTALPANDDPGRPSVDPASTTDPVTPGMRRAAGSIRSDPRQAGLNYFVLMETSERGAMRLAEFCRENGLETYVVTGNNARLFRVIALPGFASSARSSPEVRSLETEIRRVGSRWKQSGGGTTNLGDAYPVLFTGR